jgi:hypothetical protein
MVREMPTHVRPAPDIATIMALARALDREDLRSPGEIRERDQRVAEAVQGGNDDPLGVVLAWLAEVEREDEAVRSTRHRAETAVHLTSAALTLAGLLVGWGATLSAFYFDGSGRVNAVAVLAILVGLPAVLLLPFLFAALPHRVAQRVPGATLAAAVGRALSPGRLTRLVWRVFPHDLRESVALLAGRTGRHQKLYSSLQKWALLRWSQMFAVAFQLTAVVACLILVVFTDLAFGWSTTLTTGEAALDARRVHRMTSTLAAPWSWTLEDARPSLALIEESRYYRVASEPVSRDQAARLGGWWKFVVLAILVYGLLPRLITLAVAQSRLRAAARAAVIGGPGISAVLRRIHRAAVETRAVQPETADVPGTALAGAERRDRALDRAGQRAPGGVRAVVNWSAVPVEPRTVAAAFPGAPVFSAGGAATVEDDARLAQRLADLARSSGGADLVILVKGWEPPLMDFVDFVKTLRGALGGEPATIVVLPVGLDSGPALAPARPAQITLWRDRLGATGDPWLRVAAAREEVYA